MAGRAVGRREEVGRIVAVLADVGAARGGGRIVELTGEPGIGKSTVVSAVIAAAEDSGWRVWTASPTAAEAELPWTGLAQLLAGVDLDDFEGLATSHLEQLAGAIGAGRSGVVSSELVAFGLTALLDTAASGATPLLVVVDDVHWLDRATAGALAYALRGMARRRAITLLSRRDDEPLRLEPSRLVDPGTHVQFELGGLSLAILREIVAETTGAMLGRAELAQLHQRTGGNPLHTIELARAVGEGVAPADAALPPSLRDSVGARVAALPPTTRRVLGAAALTAHPTPHHLSTALGDIDVLGALGPAESAGVVTIRRSPIGGSAPTVVFSHPLLAAAAIDALTTAERRDLHAALASSADDAIERATHLVACGIEPDETLAAELDQTAHQAHAVGAIDAAVTFAQASVAATPATTEQTTRLERAYACALRQVQASRYRDANAAVTAIAAELEATGEQDPALHDLRERVALIEGVTAAVHGDAASQAATERALTFTTDPHRRYVLQARLVRSALLQNFTRGLEVAERVFGEGSEHAGFDGVLGSLVLLTTRTAAGAPVDLDAALAVADAATSDEQREEVENLLVEPLVWTDHPSAAEVAVRVIARAVEVGHLAAELSSMYQLVGYLVVRGDWRRAETISQRLSEYAAECADRHSNAADRAHLLAALGETEQAVELLARTSRALRADKQGPLVVLWVQSRAALVAHMLGHPTAADDLLAIEHGYRELGVHAVRATKFRRDLVEALVAAGRVEEAADAAERLAADAERNAVATALAESDAATAVVASAQGDHDRARARFDAAISVQREYQLGYELARTLLAAGSAARRAGQRSEARRHLDEARRLFDEMGAVVWRRRCDDEVARLGGRRSADSDELTPTERQIAELVASGMTNPEVAGAVFVSVRTVEAHLTRIYRKLGIRSRSALARALADSPPRS